MASAPTDPQHLAQLVQRVADRQELAELISRYGGCSEFQNDQGLRHADQPVRTRWRVSACQGPRRACYRVRTARGERGCSAPAPTTPAPGTSTFASDTQASGGVVSASAELCIQGQTVAPVPCATSTVMSRRRPAGSFRRALSRSFGDVLPFNEVASGLDQPLRVRWPGTEPKPGRFARSAANLHRQPDDTGPVRRIRTPRIRSASR